MRPFSLLVKPASADCNLRCRYCFYLDKCALYPDAKRHRMSDDVLTQVIRTFMATDQPQFSIGWQGGEPTLMGAAFFKRVTELQQQFGRAGAAVSNGLQTNATLITDELGEHLGRYNFLVGVSIDGPASVHDKNRVTAKGRGSHRLVVQGVEQLRKYGADFNVLTLVNSANVERPVETYGYLCENGFLFQQYIECVEFDGGGSLLPFSVTGEQWGDFMCAVFDEWIKADTRRVSIRLFDSVLAMLVEGVANVCQMGTNCCQYLVVEHNGDVYPCDFFVETDLRLGNVMTDSWGDMLSSPTYLEFGRRKREWNARCDDCEFKRFCAGDCQKHRYYGPRDPRHISRLCAGWRKFYAHTLPGFRRLAEEIKHDRVRAEREATRRRVRTGTSGQVGRNDPCPCGSGAKFKKCCGGGE